jgi:hypothetical protein
MCKPVYQINSVDHFDPENVLTVREVGCDTFVTLRSTGQTI